MASIHVTLGTVNISIEADEVQERNVAGGVVVDLVKYDKVALQTAVDQVVAAIDAASGGLT